MQFSAEVMCIVTVKMTGMEATRFRAMFSRVEQAYENDRLALSDDELRLIKEFCECTYAVTDEAHEQNKAR